MQSYLFTAAILAVSVGLIHSILGEVLIFSRMGDGTFVPAVGRPLLRERHVRILWATWHIVTIFGWALATILLRLTWPGSELALQSFVKNTVGIGMLISSLLVLYATKGMHPGWIGLLGVAGLCWLA
ncbi:MAG: hypothetical protein AAF702_46370 [Chloroflexota bacterium]